MALAVCMECMSTLDACTCPRGEWNWCDIHDRELSYSPHGYACESCGWETKYILDLVAETGMSWEEARDQIAEGYRPCEHCGWCTSPLNCVWGVVCPKCGAPPGIGTGQCREGGRNVKLHRERWLAVG